MSDPEFPVTFDVLLLLFSRFSLGLIFLIAGIAKAMDPQNFASVLSQYDLLPRKILRPVVVFLPLAELLTATCLLLDVAVWASGLFGAVLFLLFAGAVWVNLLRGRRDIPCGCFGGGEEDRLNWAIVARNFAFACLAFSVAWASSPSATMPSLFQGIDTHRPLSGEERFAVFVASTAVLGFLWLFGAMMSLRRLGSSWEADEF